MAEDRDGGIPSARADSCGSVLDEIAESPNAAALVIYGLCAIVLSIGAAVAMVMFIYLSFKYPDAANTLIPLIILPAGTLIMTHGKKALNAITDRRNQPPTAVDKPPALAAGV